MIAERNSDPNKPLLPVEYQAAVGGSLAIAMYSWLFGLAVVDAERVAQLQGMILAGQPNTACLTFMRQTWGVSRAQGYWLLKKAWAQIKDR